MKINQEILDKLDETKVYCQKCILEGIFIPLDYPKDDSVYIHTNCKHTGRNCNTLRYHKNEWHLFYGYSINACCRTCQALSNLKEMNNPENKEIQKHKRIWYDSPECKEMLKRNGDTWRASEEGKAHAIKNCEHYRNSDYFKEHGANSLKEYLKTDEFQIHIKQHNKENCDKLNSRENYYCPDCDKITIHNGFGTCLICNPLTGGNDGIASKDWRTFEITNIDCNINCNFYNICENKNNNEYKNKWGYCEKAVSSFGGHPKYLIEKYPKCKKHKNCKLMFYDDEIKEYVCWECFKKKIENNCNNIINLPKKYRCKQCGKLINCKYSFCSKECEEQFIKDRYKDFKHNNKCEKHKNEKISYKGKCWSCYKENFTNNELYNNFNILKDIQNFYPYSYIQFTCRTQESQDWKSAKTAFEQNLIDKNVGYFAYIKFYINKSNIFPLVRGKSGSLLVNQKGSDVNFSEKEEDGPARRFLKENDYQWDKTKILIIPASSESEAYAIENWLSKYCPFGS